MSIGTVKEKHKIKYTKYNVDLTNNVQKVHKVHQTETVIQNAKKRPERRKHCARALAVVRCGHRPPVANTQTHRQDR